MCLRPLAALAVAGLFFSPALADRKKSANTTRTSPAAVAQAPRPCDAHQSASMTLPSPRYLQDPPQSFAEDRNVRMEQLLKESEDLRQAREEFHRFWMNNQPATLTYDRMHETKAPLKCEQLTFKTYAVADLVVPLPAAGAAPSTEKPKTLERELIQKIRTAVEPQSWTTAGGQGTIEYFPLGMALVVNHTPAVHAAIARYLDALRKESDQQVVTDLHLMTVSDDFFEKTNLSKCFGPCEGGCAGKMPPARFLSADIARRLVCSAKEDAGTTMISAPTLTTLTGQPGRVRVGQTEHFLTGLTVQTVKGSLVFTPKNEPHELGVDMTLQPAVSADGKFVQVSVTGTVRELAETPVTMTPFTTQIRPAMKDGKGGEPVPFTQYVQEPKILARSVQEAITLPSGGTALLYGGKATVEAAVKERMPGLADVPVLADLFTRVRKDVKTNHLLVLVTSRVVKPDAGCSECEVCPAADARMVKLLADYERACREHQIDEARRLAIECLAIDPTCFGKK